jgi:hypothetical protein
MEPIRIAYGPGPKSSWLDAPRAWAKGRLWWARIPPLLWGLWTWIHHLRDPLWSGIAKGIDLGLHEAGHAIFGWFGQFIGIAGGSLFQCLCPLLALEVLRRQDDWFGMSFCLGWLGTNLFDVATYADDARAMELTLVTPFGDGSGEVLHDWNWMLGRLGWLEHDHLIAGLLRLSGSAAFLAFLLCGSWLVREMWRTREAISDR